MITQTKRRLALAAPPTILVKGTVNNLGMSTYYTMDFDHFVTTTQEGTQFTCGLDKANFVNVRNYHPLMVMYTTNVTQEHVLQGQAFINAALKREMCWPRDLATLQSYHDYCCKSMHLYCVDSVRLDDWYGQGWRPRPMSYKWIGTTQQEINTMDSNTQFVMPPPVEGAIP